MSKDLFFKQRVLLIAVCCGAHTYLTKADMSGLPEATGIDIETGELSF
jgi:hypothetical protein